MIDFSSSKINSQIFVNDILNISFISSNISNINDFVYGFILPEIKTDELFKLKSDSSENERMKEIIANIFKSRVVNPSDADDIKDLLASLISAETEVTVNMSCIYMSDLVVDDELTNAFLFTIFEESQIFYLSQNNENEAIKQLKGFSKPAAGFIIFDTEQDSGYVLNYIKPSVSWIHKLFSDKILNTTFRSNDFLSTKTSIEACKKFSDKFYKKQPEKRTDQVEILNKSAEYFRNNETFNIKEFEEEVLVKPELIGAFAKYRQDVQEKKGIEIADEFKINEKIAQSVDKFMKNVMKLDKNFHVYVHGRHEFIEKGFDNTKGMNFYKLYFQEES